MYTMYEEAQGVEYRYSSFYFNQTEIPITEFWY